MEIRTFAASGRQRECERRLSAYRCESEYDKLILLPIPTSRDGVHITGSDTKLSDLYSEVCSTTLVAGYNIPDAAADEFASRGANIYDAGLDEVFLCENAELTARGALGRILCDFPKDVSEMNIALIGYGRIGKRLVRLLLFLGAAVTVYTGKENTRLELVGCGVESRLIDRTSDFSGFDLIVNTAPARLLTDEDVLRIGENGKIMDLASGKYIPDSPCVTKLASIPDAMYPITAGGLYAKHIAKYLFDEREERPT